MRRILFALFLSCGFMPAVSAQTILPADEASAVLDKVDRLNRSMLALSCDFVQKRTSDMVEGVLSSTGRIRITFPSSLEYEMLAPYASKVSLDGGNPVMKQVLKFFSGGLSAHQGFDISVGMARGEYVLTLLPLDPQMQVFLKAVRIRLDRESLLARAVEMKDADGGVTLLEFSNVTYK